MNLFTAHTRSHNAKHFILVILLLFCFGRATNAAVTARVDRTDLHADETLTLTVRSDEASTSASPDLSALKNDFNVLGSSRNSRRIISFNGNESSTEWIITLAPLHAGNLTIPAIDVGGEKTLPISVTVDAQQLVNMANPQPVFVRSSIDTDQVYVQQQIVLTVEIYHAVQLDDLHLTDPEFDNALLKKIDQNSYQRQLNGTTYRVHEIRYAIYPQTSGELIIPEQIFSAIEDYGRSLFYSQGNSVRKMTEQHRVNVLPPPANAPTPWLPANEFSIAQQWSADPAKAKVGESITRTITLSAKGLLDSQLPDIRINNVVGVKQYADQSQGETKGQQTAESIREISVAIIPTQPGHIELPAISIPWWDVNANEIRYARLPATTLDVSGAAATVSTAAPDAVAPTAPRTGTENTPTVATGPASTLWPLLALGFGVSTLLLAGFCWYLLRRLRNIEQTVSIDTATPALPNEQQAFKHLTASCRSRNHSDTRRNLLLWAQARWPDHTGLTLQETARRLHDDDLSTHISNLERQLYSTLPTNTEFDFDGFINGMAEWRKRTKKTPAPKKTLAPLYPS